MARREVSLAARGVFNECYRSLLAGPASMSAAAAQGVAEAAEESRGLGPSEWTLYRANRLGGGFVFSIFELQGPLTLTALEGAVRETVQRNAKLRCQIEARRFKALSWPHFAALNPTLVRSEPQATTQADAVAIAGE
jgi:hypothetical protein